MLDVLTIIGARPQFIKAATVSKQIGRDGRLTEAILHTGQHFDENMSDVFFTQLGIPRPEFHLEINQGTHGEMTGRMLIGIEQILKRTRPKKVLVYGDTNSTLAGALAACKLHVPVAHVEAGLRSFNMKMPEEVNRKLTDQISKVLFCPNGGAVENLAAEGICSPNASVYMVGDVMQDASILFSKNSRPPSFVPKSNYILTTLHRAENTDDPKRLSEIVSALNDIHRSLLPVVIPLHPRTRARLNNWKIDLTVDVIEPVGYLEMLWLIENSNLVLTDSGGLQKEAFFFNKFCVTLRDETEWTELLELNVNKLVGSDPIKIKQAVKDNLGRVVPDFPELFGGGYAAQKIVNELS